MSLTWTCPWSSNIISLTADLTEQILTPVCLSHLHYPLKPAPSAAPVCGPPRNTVTMNPVALVKTLGMVLRFTFFHLLISSLYSQAYTFNLQKTFQICCLFSVFIITIPFLDYSYSFCKLLPLDTRSHIAARVIFYNTRCH